MSYSSEQAINGQKPGVTQKKAAMPRIGQPSPASRVVDRSILERIPGTPEFRAARGGMPRINVPSYDEGTDRVQGDQVALIHDGEKVVPADENPDNTEATAKAEAAKAAAEDKVANTGVPLISSNTPDEKVTERTPEQLIAEPKEETQGSVLGKEWLKRIGAPEPSTSESTETAITPRTIGMPKIGPEAHQETAGGPLISGAPTSETPSEQRDLRNMERNAKVANLEKQRQDALASGDLTTADKLQAAKLELQKTPWSDRSLLGKFGRIGEMVASRAPGLAPIVATIPGSEGYRAAEGRSAYGRIATDTENDLREAQANDKETPKPKLLSGEENLRTDQNGNRERAWQMPHGEVMWVPEGQAPTAAQSSGAQPQATVGAQPQATVGAQPQATAQGTTGTPKYTYGKAPAQVPAKEETPDQQLIDATRNLQQARESGDKAKIKAAQDELNNVYSAFPDKAPPTPEAVRTFVKNTLPSYTNIPKAQQAALALEATQATTKADLDRIMARADGAEKAEQVHKDSMAAVASGRLTTFQNNGITANEKLLNDPHSGYLGTAAQLEQTRKSIVAGADGNALLTNMVPTMEVLAINHAAGISRISPAEATAAGLSPEWATRWNAWAQRAGTGSLSPELAEEGRALVDIIQDTQYRKLLQQQLISANGHHLSYGDVPSVDRNGEITTLDKTVNQGKSKTSAAPQIPTGATEEVVVNGKVVGHVVNHKYVKLQ